MTKLILLVYFCFQKSYVKSQQIQHLKQTNLLFIMFDDLRPDLSFYGREYMLTPNFERLANRSVIFDYAFCQVPVCNPSRNSILTGLRPDTAQMYNFQRSVHPFMSLPAQLVRSGYNTAGFGKIFHWEENEKSIWNFEHWDNDWYEYQAKETAFMNSSIMPDKQQPIEKYRDHQFTTKAINALRKLEANRKPFMLAVGYKLPHTELHVPYEYFKMYDKPHIAKQWKLSKEELRFPPTAPEISYRCCTEEQFRFMREEGSLPWNRSTPIGNITEQFTQEMHDQLMTGYAAGITFVDQQLGRLLDVLDELNLWDKMTIVLTADHGINNGEKGIWEKWSFYDESARVPLLIAHPLSPYKGQHYQYPVELLDIYPTVLDLLQSPISRKSACFLSGWKCLPLQGKSLSLVVLGQYLHNQAVLPNMKDGVWAWISEKLKKNLEFLEPYLSTNFSSRIGESKENKLVTVKDLFQLSSLPMPELPQKFAVTQIIRCALKRRVRSKLLQVHSTVDLNFNKSRSEQFRHMNRNKIKSMYLEYRRSSYTPIWSDCDIDRRGKMKDEYCIMGYSMRSQKYRYVGYFHYNRANQRPMIHQPLFDEELYDHRGEKLGDFTHLETLNLAVKASHAKVVEKLRKQLISFIIKSYSSKQRGGKK